MELSHLQVRKRLEIAYWELGIGNWKLGIGHLLRIYSDFG